MSIAVRVQTGDKPSIQVTGSAVEKMRRDQLGELLTGENDLIERINARHHGKGIDGFHLNDDDQVPGKLTDRKSVRHGV